MSRRCTENGTIVVGKVGDGQRRAREKMMDRYYLDWRENDHLLEQLKESNFAMSFAEHGKNRRVKLIEEEEAREGWDGQCPLFTWRWNQQQGGPEKVRRSVAIPNSVARGPYDENSEWNLLDSGFEQGPALFRELDEEDQRQFSFALTRILAHGRYKEVRCKGLFKALREAHDALQDHVVKGNRLKSQRTSARQELVNVKDDLLVA